MFRRILVFCLMFLLLSSNTVYAEDNDIAESKRAEETANDVDMQAWLEDFEDIYEEDLKNLGIEFNEDTVISAAVNTFDNEITLYIVLSSGEKYRIFNPSMDIRWYLQLCGVTLKQLSFEDGALKDFLYDKALAGSPLDSKTEDWKKTVTWIAVVSLIVGVVVVGYAKKEKKHKVYASVSSGSVTKSPEGVPNVKFSDVEGIDELKTDIMRLVDCLKNPKKYEYIGARTPKGVILYGPPGTGKTLIAKAIAGEAGVPFISAVGSDFVEKYVGVGAQRVRDLYKSAKKQAPCIVFIDEIDAVAGRRGGDENSERDQTVNALLAELDGFGKKDSVITICATNRLDMLDSAFQRAGRFDLKLAVGLPDKKSRLNILKIHSRDKRLGETISLESIAARTVGFSGAELEALLNEAALVAVGKDKEYIEPDDIDDAFFKMVMQGNKKPRDEITETNRVVAWHESGHVLVTKLLTDDTVSSVTIVGSSSGAGGVTFRTPKEDNILHSKKYLESSVKIMYGGRAAEELYFNDKDSITTGASQDIKQATNIITEYLAIYGMGNNGMLDLTQFSRDMSSIINEASDLAKRLYDETIELLRQNIGTLSSLAEELLAKETLDEAEIDNVIKCSVA